MQSFRTALIVLATVAPVALTAQAQTGPPAPHFFAEGRIADSLVRFSTQAQPKPERHAVLCCDDSFRVVGTDTVYTWRNERAAVYRGNWLGGAGITVVLHRKLAADEARMPKAALAERIFRPGSACFARQQGEGFVRDGIEIRYKDQSGQVFTTASGDQPSSAQVRVVSVQKAPGRSVGGFGSYNYVLELTVNASLFGEGGQVLPLREGRIRIGIWGPAEP